MWNTTMKILFSSPFRYSFLGADSSIFAETPRDSIQICLSGFYSWILNAICTWRSVLNLNTIRSIITSPLYTACPTKQFSARQVKIYCHELFTSFCLIVTLKTGSVCVYYAPDIRNQIFAKWRARHPFRSSPIKLHVIHQIYMSKGKISFDQR